jgi:hypothetical protein
MAGEDARVMTPLRWLGEKLRILRAPQQRAEGEYEMNEAGELVFVQQPGVDGEGNPDNPEVVMVEQADGTLLPMVQQADGTMVPVETKPVTGEGEPVEPLLPLPEQTGELLNYDEEEEDPLTDLADITGILSSAFDDESAIDPDREAISRSLDDVDVMALLKTARNVLATFKQ